MLAGELPFSGERELAIVYSILKEPEPVTPRRAGLPLEVNYLLGKALAKDWAERTTNANHNAVPKT